MQSTGLHHLSVRLRRAVPSAAALALLLTAAAAHPAGTEIASSRHGAGAVSWEPVISGYDHLTLTVDGPSGRWVERFAEGEAPFFSLYDTEGQLLADGIYQWELRAAPRLDAAVRERFTAAREEGADGLGEALRASGALPPEAYQAGWFTMSGGALMPFGQDEQEAEGATAGIGSESAPVSSISGRAVLSNSDGVIRNSLCVGSNCTNTPSFSDSTVVMSEANTRIKFDDTSLSPYPNRDWEIQANSNNSGGPSYLGFNDCGTSAQGGCADDLVFAVEANARLHSLYVDSSGDVGFGTNTPTMELHLVSGDTPGLRLEQDSSSAFTPQTWDLSGNETSLFVRDVTHGSNLPFRIYSDSESGNLVVRGNRVGVGTTQPDAALHVFESDGSAQLHVEEASTTAAARSLLRLENNGQLQFVLERSDGANGSWSFTHNGNQLNVSKGGTGANELAIFDNGNVQARGTITGNIANPSSKALKTDFVDLDPRQILAKVSGLPVLQWRYKVNDQGMVHMGPMAEDFFATFGVGADDRIFLADVNGVALAAIQGLSQVVEDKQEQIEELRAENERKEAALEELSRRLERLEALID